MRRSLEETVQMFGQIVHCVNAAGMVGGLLLRGGRGGGLDEVLAVDLRGVWTCEREEVRQLLRQEMRDVR